MIGRSTRYRPGAQSRTRQPLEAVGHIRVHARLVSGGLDLFATAAVAFLGGWIVGYLSSLA